LKKGGKEKGKVQGIGEASIGKPIRVRRNSVSTMDHIYIVSILGNYPY
jgi:hypothetical protein